MESMQKQIRYFLLENGGKNQKIYLLLKWGNTESNFANLKKVALSRKTVAWTNKPVRVQSML